MHSEKINADKLRVGQHFWTSGEWVEVLDIRPHRQIDGRLIRNWITVSFPRPASYPDTIRPICGLGMWVKNPVTVRRPGDAPSGSADVPA